MNRHDRRHRSVLLARVTVSRCSDANPAACTNNAFATTPPAHPVLCTPPSQATLLVLLLNSSKNRLLLQCSNTVTAPAKTLKWLLCILPTLITPLKGLSTDQGVISDSLEGWYDLMMTYGGMLITISSSQGRVDGWWWGHMSAIRAYRWNVWLHILFIVFLLDSGFLIMEIWEILVDSASEINKLAVYTIYCLNLLSPGEEAWFLSSSCYESGVVMCNTSCSTQV